MNFRGKIEAVLVPLVQRLRRELSVLPTLEVLNNYQLRMHAVQTDKSGVPDGFIVKWRYLWALLLAGPYLEKKGDVDSNFASIDDLTEKIFETYTFGAIFEPGKHRGSEKEFLTRLGLGLRVREPDILAFPEQLREWALARLSSFDDSYFRPSYGLCFEEILSWLESLGRKLEDRLNGCVRDLVAISSDAKSVQAAFVEGAMTIEAARLRMEELQIGDRIESNGRRLELIHIFTRADLGCGLPALALDLLLGQFAARPGAVSVTYSFPHEENPLERQLFVALPSGDYYFLDPANALRVMAKTFEREIVAKDKIRNRYLKTRDRATERWVANCLRKVFPSNSIYSNYFHEKGEHERDVLVRFGDTIIIVECKNNRVRPFRGSGDDLLKFEEDFKNSIQFGYEQALTTKKRVLGRQETTFLDEEGRFYFAIKLGEVKRFYIICVAITPRGPFGTDLAYELKKPGDEPFPLALNLFDLDIICDHLGDPQRFIAYLDARQRMHGRISTGDELNFAGYFVEYGNLDFPDSTFISDDFSAVFDRAWFRKKGVEVKEPGGPPIAVTSRRAGNRLHFEYSTGRRETFRIPPEMVESLSGRSERQMKGSMRNKPCPCGSGMKFKHCHGA